MPYRSSVSTRSKNVILSLAFTLIVEIFASVFIYDGAGILPAVLWAAVTNCAELASAAAGNEEAAHSPAYLGSSAVRVAGWTGFAAFSLSHGTPDGWRVAMMVVYTLAIHTIFILRVSRRLTLYFLLPPVAVLVASILMMTMSYLPHQPHLAAAVVISGLGSLASLAIAKQLANEASIGMSDALAAATAARSRLEFALDASGDGHFEFNLDTMAYRPAPKLTRSFGYAAPAQSESTLTERIHPVDAPKARAKLMRCRDGLSDGWDQDMRVRSANGEYRWVHVRLRVLNDPEGRTLFGMVFDFTDRKKLEIDLENAKEIAEASSKAKGDFLANMSHEIRTPLNGVLGMAQSLAGERLTPPQKERVALILDSGATLVALLNDVLDFSKIEAGKLDLAPTPGNLAGVLRRTRDLFEQSAKEKGLDLVLRFDGSLPERLSFDPVRVRQCVSNLLSNAVKFSDRGEVVVWAAARRLETDERLVTITVADTGIGIDEETKSRLFEAFTQGDESTTRRFGGTGLGLTISRRLARLMGGDLTVSSMPGLGSTFTLTFKATQIDAGPAVKSSSGEAPPAFAHLSGRRVLVVDDNAINRQVVRLFLSPHGVEMEEASNGAEALTALERQPFDLVLLDVHMPVMDGAETIARIRSVDAPWSGIPVLALTADALTGQREHCLSLGMSDFISKPLEQRELLSKCDELLTANQAGG